MASGTIVYCSREDHAPPMFAACLARLAQRHPDAKIIHVITNDIATGRNSAALAAEGDWIWFIDTDMLFAPETLERLLAHDVDVVQVLCLMRHPPHEPVLYEGGSELRRERLTGPPRLVETDKVGAGGTLYRRRVFEGIPGPWFDGVLGAEDISFARKIHAAGFRQFVDLTTPARHLTPITILPVYQAATGTWAVRYEAMNGGAIDITTSRVVHPTDRELARVR